MTHVPVAAGKNIRNVAERNEFGAFGGTVSDRMNRIYMIFIYPVVPVKKRKMLYYELGVPWASR